MVNFEQCGVTLCHPTEAYRSGHNGPDSKSGSPHGLVGSNPTASVTKTPENSGVIFIGESNKNPRRCRGNQGALASGKKPPML